MRPANLAQGLPDALFADARIGLSLSGLRG